jgi:glycosyltransferase involved in cell wall biosynthesis
MPAIWGIHDVIGWGNLNPSGCGFYRIVLPLDELANHGWDTCYSNSSGRPVFSRLDIIIAQRFDQISAVPGWAALRATGEGKLVYEIDDDPFSVDEANWLARPEFRKSDVLATLRGCAALAHLVTVTTEPLAEVFRQFNPNVAVIANYIPQELLSISRKRHERLTVGWAGGASHMRDMAMIAPVWREVMDGTGVRGHFIGCDYRNMLRPDGFEFTGWSENPRDYHRLVDFDIALVPIAPHPFARSKSHIKALEFAALGIPVIASDCEAYRDLVVDGVTGFLVTGAQQWRDRMLTLIHDGELRETMGAKARELAAGWTIEGTGWRQWDAAYRKLLEDG